MEGRAELHLGVQGQRVSQERVNRQLLMESVSGHEPHCVNSTSELDVWVFWPASLLTEKTSERVFP